MLWGFFERNNCKPVGCAFFTGQVHNNNNNKEEEEEEEVEE